MATLHTQLNPRSAEFAANRAAMLEQVDALHSLLAHVHQGGGAKAQERHTSRGKLYGKSVLAGLDGKGPYMTRYWLGPFRLHLMHRGDAGRGPHDHPWWFLTFPLNSYVEEVAFEDVDNTGQRVTISTKLNIVRRFRFHFRPAHYTHRILGPYDPVMREIKATKTSHPMKWLAVLYKPGMTLAEVSDMLDSLDIKPERRLIRTLVLRGRSKWAWGFHRLRPPAPPEWVHHEDYFRLPEYDQ